MGMNARIVRKFVATVIPLGIVVMLSGAECGGGRGSQFNDRAPEDGVQGVCDKTFRFSVSGNIYKQVFRDELYNDSKYVRSDSMRRILDDLRTGSTTEGSPEHTRRVDALVQEVLQLCTVKGWKRPGNV
jgi:hypothetical protein